MKGFCHNTFHERFVSSYPTPCDEKTMMKAYLLVDPDIRQQRNRLCQDYRSRILHSHQNTTQPKDPALQPNTEYHYFLNKTTTKKAQGKEAPSIATDTSVTPYKPPKRGKKHIKETISPNQWSHSQSASARDL